MSNPSTIPKTARARGKIAPVKFAHIVFKTSNYEEMIRWYKTVLEAEPMTETPVVTFLTYDDEHHRIAIANMPDLAPIPPQSVGVEHCAFTYDSLEDLFATYERLVDLDITPYWTINHGPTLSMYYRDPDNNQIELQVDLFESIEATNRWFEQSDFDTNPIGVKFDPEDLIKRYRSGEAKEELLVRRRIPAEEVAAQFPAPPETG